MSFTPNLQPGNAAILKSDLFREPVNRFHESREKVDDEGLRQQNDDPLDLFR